MAALVCDICGGKLMMGAGGIATCDSCGMEYTQDRMKEKIQEIKGVVRVDNSHMIDNWMNMGKAAAEAGNQKEAYEYFTKVLEVEPDNWRAIYEKGKAAAWQSTLGNLRLSELYQAVKAALSIIEKLGMPEENVREIKNEFLVAIYSVNNAIYDLKKQNFDRHDDKYYDLHWDEWWDVHQSTARQTILQIEDAMSLIEGFDDETSVSNILFMKKRICELLRDICDCQTTYWDNYNQETLRCFGIDENQKKPFVEKHTKLVMEIRETEPDYASSKYSMIDPWSPPYRWESNRYEKIEKYWKSQYATIERQHQEALRKKKVEKYWAEHPDEKKKLEAELSAIKEEEKQLGETIRTYEQRINDLRGERNKLVVPAQAQLKDLQSRLSSLREERDKCGLFQGKQKKALQSQIDTLTQEESEIKRTVDKQMEAAKTEVNQKISMVELEMKPYKDKMSELSKKTIKINSKIQSPC